MQNHLASESSPYLLQHADNPVDWHPWGSEALARARDEDKPIFLSIGYSACHWCHVMERESFTDSATAAYLNEHFVSIKVDREERPDLDEIYMGAVAALTGSGGWPLSVWLTGDGLPFYGGTYFPPEPRYGMPSFRQVLENVADLWTNRRADLSQAGERLREHLAMVGDGLAPAGSRGTILEKAVQALAGSFDPVLGGWGPAPKFPQALTLDFLLAHQAIAPQTELWTGIVTALDAMARGGMYDQVGGGFHRYSTDATWLVPHFEKMLYDSVQLARCYVHAWQLLRKPSYRLVAEQTLDYLRRDMQHDAGGFFSAEDADSEGTEGAFYTWTLEQIRAALPPAEAAMVAEVYAVSESGNFEGTNILHLAGDPPPDFERVRARLQTARETRPRPARDEKMLAGWNGLALATFSEAAEAFGSDRYRETAEGIARFIEAELVQEGDRLAHSWKDGRIGGNAFLDDYACVIEGLLALYQTTLSERWFTLARDLADHMIEHFGRLAGGFFDTSDDHEQLIIRPRSLDDSPTPSGNAMAATVLLKLASFTGESRYWDLAEQTIGTATSLLQRAPVMFGQWLHALLLLETGLTEVAIVGDLAAPQTLALLKVVRSSFRPAVITGARPAGAASFVPMLRAREPGETESAAAWVCRRSTCAAPTGDPERLRAALQ